jgi:hypothetical protein
LLAGRLTAHLKEIWPGVRVGQIEEKFLIASMVQMELIRAVKIRVSCHAAKSLKRIQQTQQLANAKLEV